MPKLLAGVIPQGRSLFRVLGVANGNLERPFSNQTRRRRSLQVVQAVCITVDLRVADMRKDLREMQIVRDD